MVTAKKISSMYRQINFFHPSWNSIVAFNVADNVGVYDVVLFINQYGYIPYNQYSYALALRGMWITENYYIGSLDISPNDVILIVPFQLGNSIQQRGMPTVLFKGKGDGMLANPEAQAYFTQQQIQPTVIEVDKNTQWNLIEWVKKMLT